METRYLYLYLAYGILISTSFGFLTYYGAVIILADNAFWIVNITVMNEQADELNDEIFQWASSITLK